MKRISLIFSLTFIVLFSFSSLLAQPKRDNMTDKEDMQVREAQELDLRMKVYVKIIDRRLSAIFNPNATPTKETQKDLDILGELRTGTFNDLFWDIQKTLDEAILKIDDAAERDINNPLFGKAVHILADGCQKWGPQFKSGMDKSSDEKEKGLILGSLEYCNQITEAAAKVPKEEKKKKNK